MAELVEMVKFQSWEHLFEPPVPLHEKEMRIFYHKLTFSKDDFYLTSQVHDVNISLDKQVLTEVLEVPNQGNRSLKDEWGSVRFLKLIGKLDDLNIKSVTKKSLKGEYQLFFELVNKVLLLRTEKHTAITGPDLFLMEALSKFKHANLPAIIIEHMHKVMTAKNGHHGLAYGFLLNRVLAYFDIECGPRKDGFVEQRFTVFTFGGE